MIRPSPIVSPTWPHRVGSALLSATLVVASMAATGAPRARAAEVSPADARAAAPAFSLDDLDGRSVSLAEHAGKVVVISFWATWCGPCMQEIPFMNGFFEDLADDGLVVLAINTDGPETLADVRNAVRRGRWTLPVLLDLDGAVSAQLNPRGTQPFTMFVDREGRVAATHEGFASGDEVHHRATIDALLAEPAR